MKIIIEGNPKEIAALVLELQERHIDKDYSCNEDKTQNGAIPHPGAIPI